MCLMSSPCGCVSVMVYRALHAPRVSVFYRVLPVLNRSRCSSKVFGNAVYVPTGGNMSLVCVLVGVVITYGDTVIVPWGAVCYFHMSVVSFRYFQVIRGYGKYPPGGKYVCIVRNLH